MECDKERFLAMKPHLATDFQRGVPAEARNGPTRIAGVLLVYSVPVLLVAIAAFQIYLAQSETLSAWKGGGFGMFSTVDQPQSRWVRAHMETASDRHVLLLGSPATDPPGLGRMVRRARAMPSQGALDDLAAAVGHASWTVDQGQLRAVTDPSTAAIEVDAVEIEVLRLRYTRRSSTAAAQLIGSATWARR